MRVISESEVLAVHAGAMAESGTPPQPLRNRAGLESALARGALLGQYTQADAIDECAAVSYAIIQNHPFVDGNKRTAWAVLRYALLMSGFTLTAPQDEAVEMMLACANGTASDMDLAAWVRRHCRPS